MRISDWSSDVCSSDLTNPDAVSEVLLLGQDVMDSDPAKFQQVMKLVRGMLTGDGKLKSDIDAVLATRGGKSVDGLLAQVEQKKIRLPALKDDIAAVLTALKKRPDAFSRMVAEFRSEERRGGKKCVSPCRSRWSPDH